MKRSDLLKKRVISNYNKNTYSHKKLKMIASKKYRTPHKAKIKFKIRIQKKFSVQKLVQTSVLSQRYKIHSKTSR